MTEPQTFYAVLDIGDDILAGPYENANKAHAVAKGHAEQLNERLRVIAYTVIATYEGTDD